MDKIVALCKRRGFVYPSSEIYGGLANTWDFGPYGAQLKKNVKDLWWKRFVESRSDIIGIDSGILMNPAVWKASGHVAGFTDPLVECRYCHRRFRVDSSNKPMDHGSAPFCTFIGKRHLSDDFDGLTEPRMFNLMFKTYIGSVENSGSEVYLRPETAQGMFVNFKNMLDSMRVKIPFGMAQIGKAFRNEITPGNFIFRVLEFEQMEIEYFIRENEWEHTFEQWKKEMELWLAYIGIKKQNWSIRAHQKDELSHYSKRTIDFEYEYPFGKKELYGLAYRTDFDLIAHQKSSRVDFSYTDSHTGKKFIPHVIESSFGVERTILALLCDAYTQEKDRIVLKLDAKIAPVHIAVFPLLRNRPELIEKAQKVFNGLKMKYRVEYDDNGNIGKRYRRQDEIGTPLCVTIDYDTLDDDTITVRERDTMHQERITIEKIETYCENKIKLQ